MKEWDSSSLFSFLYLTYEFTHPFLLQLGTYHDVYWQLA